MRRLAQSLNLSLGKHTGPMPQTSTSTSTRDIVDFLDIVNLLGRVCCERGEQAGCESSGDMLERVATGASTMCVGRATAMEGSEYARVR